MKSKSPCLQNITGALLVYECKTKKSETLKEFFHAWWLSLLHMHDISSEISLLKTKQTQLSQSPPIYLILLSLNHRLIFLLDLLKYVHVSLTGEPRTVRRTVHRFGITSAEERRRIIIFLTYASWSSYCCPEYPMLSWLWGCIAGSAWYPQPGPPGHSLLSSFPACWPWAWPCAWELFLPGCNTLLHISIIGLGITPWGIPPGIDPPLLDFVLLVTTVWACN